MKGQYQTRSGDERIISKLCCCDSLFFFSCLSSLWEAMQFKNLFLFGLSIVNSVLNPYYFPPIKKASFFVLNISIEYISFSFFSISSLGPQIHHIRDNFDFISFSYFLFSSPNLSKSQASYVYHIPTILSPAPRPTCRWKSGGDPVYHNPISSCPPSALRPSSFTSYFALPFALLCFYLYICLIFLVEVFYLLL